MTKNSAYPSFERAGSMIAMKGRLCKVFPNGGRLNIPKLSWRRTDSGVKITSVQINYNFIIEY